MKNFFAKLGKILLLIGMFVLNILRDWIFGFLSLIIGTCIIFLLGASVWLLSGYKGVDTYFKALTTKK